MRTRFKNLAAIATASLLATIHSASARDPISIEALSSMPKIQSVSMSSDGKNIVALVGKEGAEEYETSLATWQLDNLAAGPTITASGDDNKPSTAAWPWPPKCSHTGVMDRVPCSSRCDSSDTKR